MNKLLTTLFFTSIFINIYAHNFPITEQDKDVKNPIIYVDMVGDLFHTGHINLLKRIKEMFDSCTLIVGIVSDEDVASYKRLPVMTLEERSGIIAACRYVDGIVPGCPLCVTDELIEEYKIDFVIHADDFDQETLEYYYGNAIRQNKFRSMSYTSGISTSRLISRVKNRNY